MRVGKPTTEIINSREGMQLSFFQLDDPVLSQVRDEILIVQRIHVQQRAQRHTVGSGAHGQDALLGKAHGDRGIDRVVAQHA